MIPPRPATADDERGSAALRPRYEDITQDGRLIVTALMPGIGPSVWSALDKQKNKALESFRAQGILPILSRLIMAGEGGPLSVNGLVHFDGCFRLARQKDGERFFLNMWMDASAQVASTFGPRPAADAPRACVGRVFAEHVVTRPFAPPGQRKVSHADLAGLETMRIDEHVFEPADALVAGHTLEEIAQLSFGLMHTDSNQHVNSMVYPKIFEEAVVQHLRTKTLLARTMEIRWRKPCFVGERVSIRAHMVDDVTALGAITVLGADKPNATVKMILG